jgi:hypothetical protein
MHTFGHKRVLLDGGKIGHKVSAQLVVGEVNLETEEDEGCSQTHAGQDTQTHLAKGCMDVTVGIRLERQTRDVLLHTLLDVFIIGKHGAFVWRGHLLLENASDGLEQGQHAFRGQADVKVHLASNHLLNQLLATNMLGPGSLGFLCSLVLWRAQ